jgi:hypothetical protein
MEGLSSTDGGGNAVQNIEATVKGDILTLKIDLTKEFGKSSSGKSLIIASTEGNVSVEDREDIKMGINIYTKA